MLAGLDANYALCFGYVNVIMPHSDRPAAAWAGMRRGRAGEGRPPVAPTGGGWRKIVDSGGASHYSGVHSETEVSI